jgi:hypothetical protein
MDIYIVDQKGLHFILFNKEKHNITILTMRFNYEKKVIKFIFSSRPTMMNYLIIFQHKFFFAVVPFIQCINSFHDDIFFFDQTTSVDTVIFFTHDIFQKELHIRNQHYILSITFLLFLYTMSTKQNQIKYSY